MHHPMGSFHTSIDLASGFGYQGTHFHCNPPLFSSSDRGIVTDPSFVPSVPSVSLLRIQLGTPNMS
jgi:hypothetical protein